MELSSTEAGRGEAMVLLHGFTGNVTSWDDLGSRLESSYRVVRVELPGHGASPAPADPAAARLPAVADALAARLDRLGIERAHFIGYSMGGRALLHFAAAHGKRILSMAVLSASPGIEDSEERAVRAAADSALARRLEGEGLEAFVERWMAQPLFASLAQIDPASFAAERARKLSGKAPAFAAALRAMSPGHQPSLWTALADMAAPALIVAGTLDEKYGAIATRTVAAMPQARLALLAGAGHSLLVEKPAELAALIEDFLRERRDG
ncbi:MAG: 2-succinyl-6-hydroxy-2,4-cyclohexadiene-1-carboxylate synthase [Deltaproteobacteria bacterium]